MEKLRELFKSVPAKVGAGAGMVAATGLAFAGGSGPDVTGATGAFAAAGTAIGTVGAAMVVAAASGIVYKWVTAFLI